MIDVVKQNSLFEDVSKCLSKKVEVYAIGGTAMMFLGLKEATKDIDLVFSNADDRKAFEQALRKLNYTDYNYRLVYGEKKNTPTMLSLLDVRFDLFLFKIISTDFSEDMQKRADEVHQFGDNLIIKVANPHDILIMKAVTGRDKDDADILSIINNSSVDWKLIIEEAKKQVSFGNMRTILDLGTTLESLKNYSNAKIPMDVLDSLWNILKEQVDKKAEGSKGDGKGKGRKKGKDKSQKLLS